MNAQLLHRRAFLLTALYGGLGLVACGEKGAKTVDANVAYYTCTMHPSVRSQDPNGKCPICSMDLVAVLKKGADRLAAGENQERVHPGDQPELTEFKVPVEQQQQIGVTYAEAVRRPLRRSIRSVGTVAADKSKQWEFVARVDGYIQTLYVTSPGEAVEEGQALLTIYSPDLLTTSREFVSLLETRDRAGSAATRENAQRLVDSAKLRLAQWNVTEQQIVELEKSRKPAEFLTLHSPFQGVVEDVPVGQGRKVSVGDRLIDVADLSVVWVWAEFYENELPALKKGQKVAIRSDSRPAANFEGMIALINPFIDPQTRTGKVRIDVANPDLVLQPGMYVNLELAVEMGDGLTIPVNAVLPTGLRSLTFIDKGEGRLEPRFLKTGGRFGEFYEVLGGLVEGERVVASANFLIDAESKVQGAVKSFAEPQTLTGDSP